MAELREAETALVDVMLRASALWDDPLKHDAFTAMRDKGADAFGLLSDESTREIYSFLCGVVSGLTFAGFNVVALLYVLQAPGVRGDLVKMRAALKQTWEALSA